MKHAKKFASLLLALVMIFALATGVIGAQEGTLTGGSITINDAVPGQTYKAYQILYLESYNKDAGAYAYKANSAWETWLKTQTSYVSFDDQGYVTWCKNLTCGQEENESHTHSDSCYTIADAAAFAKLAQVEAAKMTADSTATAPAAAEGETYSTVTFNNLKLGYYLIDTTLGTLCSLDTTNPNVVMEEKNEVPTNVKTVEEDSTGNYGEKNDADIGQTVNFKSTITAQAGAENYVFHDEMSTGLTLDANSIKVYEADETTEIPATTTNGDNSVTNYVIKTTNTCKEDCDFEIEFKQEFLNSITTATQIIIKYSAKLNENAVVGINGNPNKSYLDYGEINSTTHKPGSSTPPSETKTYTWDMDILKYANGDESKVLKDAQFVLLNNDKTKVATIVSGKVTGWVTVPTANGNGSITWPENTVLTTDANGKIEIDGLDADTYYLREVKAPDGYNKLADDVTVTIKGAEEKENAESGKKELVYTTVIAKVNNQSGTELPSTGGIGTTIFYAVGSILVIGAAVLLVTKKRMSMKG